MSVQPAAPAREAPEGRNPPPNAPAQRTAARPDEAKGAARPSRRRWVRWGFFGLLPLVLVAGLYWYVTGGAIMSEDDAYINAETLGVTTDVSGIVKEVGVIENQCRLA